MKKIFVLAIAFLLFSVMVLSACTTQSESKKSPERDRSADACGSMTCDACKVDPVCPSRTGCPQC